jgi:hypothetical protein
VEERGGAEPETDVDEVVDREEEIELEGEAVVDKEEEREGG